MFAAATAARGTHGEPHLVAGGQAIDGLQNEIEREGELELADDDGNRLLSVERHKIAAAHLTLDLEAQLFEEVLDGQIEAGFQKALQRSDARTALAYPRFAQLSIGAAALGIVKPHP
jgi:hypothetical protein